MSRQGFGGKGWATAPSSTGGDDATAVKFGAVGGGGGTLQAKRPAGAWGDGKKGWRMGVVVEYENLSARRQKLPCVRNRGGA